MVRISTINETTKSPLRQGKSILGRASGSGVTSCIIHHQRDYTDRKLDKPTTLYMAWLVFAKDTSSLSLPRKCWDARTVRISPLGISPLLPD